MPIKDARCVFDRGDGASLKTARKRLAFIATMIAGVATSRRKTTYGVHDRKNANAEARPDSTGDPWKIPAFCDQRRIVRL